MQNTKNIMMPPNLRFESGLKPPQTQLKRPIKTGRFSFLSIDKFAPKIHIEQTILDFFQTSLEKTRDIFGAFEGEDICRLPH